MGHWGVKSYENDEAGDALDAGFERTHGQDYEELMDDANPLTPEQVQAKLGNPATLKASLEALAEEMGVPEDEWDDVARLAYVGVVVRHVEIKVALPSVVRDMALAFLKNEEIDWEESTMRRLRRDKEIRIVEGAQLAEL